jgi:putative lipoprotein
MTRRSAVLFLAACTLGCPAPEDDVTGVVTYRERIALPPSGVKVVVRLRDAGGGRLDTLTLMDPGQVPIPFRLRYALHHVEAGRTYEVEATIAIDGEVIWETPEPVRVITGGAPVRDVEVVVRRP